MSGTIEKVGANVKGLVPGDRVAVDPAVYCGKCDQCLADRRHTCRNLTFLGCPGQADGCLGDYIVMPDFCCFKIPDDMSLETAALVEPLSIGIYTVKRAGNVAGLKVGVLGSGPIGLCVTAAARSLGADAIYATDKIDARLDTVLKAGARWSGNPDREDVVASVKEQEPEQLDVVYECCGQQDAIDQAAQMLKPGGKIVIVGIPEVDKITFDIDYIRRNELSVINVRRQNNCVEDAIDLLAAADFSWMVTHRFPLEETKKAFDLVAAYEDGVIKAIITL